MGGRVLPVDYLRVRPSSRTRGGLRTHLDGARLFNAIVKLAIDEPAAVAGFDSVSVCLSKGLGAPAGSVLLGLGLHRRRAALAQGARRRHASGGHLGGGRLVRTRPPRRAVGGGSRGMPPTSRRDCAPSGSRSSRRRPISCSWRFRSSGRGAAARIWRSAALSHRSGRAPASPLISMRRAPRSMSRCGRFESWSRGVRRPRGPRSRRRALSRSARVSTSSAADGKLDQRRLIPGQVVHQVMQAEVAADAPRPRHTAGAAG